MGAEITFVKTGGLSPLEVPAAKETSSVYPTFCISSHVSLLG